MEVIRIVVRLSGAQTPAGVTHLGIFDLDDLGAHPREGLRTRRTGLELGEIDDLHALQEGEVRKIGGHEALLGRVWLGVCHNVPRNSSISALTVSGISVGGKCPAPESFTYREPGT